MRGRGGDLSGTFPRESHTVGLQRSWGCEPSTSYSTSNVGLQHIPTRLTQRSSQDTLSFSLQSDKSPLTKRQPIATFQRQSPRENLSSLLGSISLSMLRVKPSRHKHQQADAQGISFEVSELHASHRSTTRKAVRLPSSNVSTTASMSFEFSDDGTTVRQQPLFASVSSACASKIRKRKAPSIATDTLAASAANLTGRQAAPQRPPLMQLAQGAATAITAALQEGGEDERPSLAAARRKLKKSAMSLPSQVRRLAAGAFAGDLHFSLSASARSLPCYHAQYAHMSWHALLLKGGAFMLDCSVPEVQAMQTLAHLVSCCVQGRFPRRS